MEICVKKKGLRALMVAPWAQLWGYSLAMEYTPSFAEDADLRENLPGGVRFESSGSQPEMIFFFAFYETFSVVPSGKMGDQGCS